MAFYISGPKLLFETTEISIHPNSTQQESNYIYLYTMKFGTSIKIRLNRKFESTEFETTRVNCMLNLQRFATLGLYVKFFLYRILFYSGFRIDNCLFYTWLINKDFLHCDMNFCLYRILFCSGFRIGTV